MLTDKQRLDELAKEITMLTGCLEEMKSEIIDSLREYLPASFLDVTKSVVVAQHLNTNRLPQGKLTTLKTRVTQLSHTPELLEQYVCHAGYWDVHNQPLGSAESGSEQSNEPVLDLDCRRSVLEGFEQTHELLWELLAEYGYEQPLDFVPELPSSIVSMSEDYEQNSRMVLAARLQAMLLRQQHRGQETSQDAAMRKWEDA